MLDAVQHNYSAHHYVMVYGKRCILARLECESTRRYGVNDLALFCASGHYALTSALDLMLAAAGWLLTAHLSVAVSLPVSIFHP